MRSARVVMLLALGVVGTPLAACGSTDAEAGLDNIDEQDGDAGGTIKAASSSADGGSARQSDAASAPSRDSGSAARDGAASGGSGTTGTDAAAGSGGSSGTGGSTSKAIATHCTSALPTGTQAADISHPTTVVGTGTAASCTFAALSAAVSKGGVVTFNCGAAPTTIGVTATLVLSTKTDTVIDGGNTVTLDGQNAVQIMKFNSPNFRATETRVTLQHLTLINGKATPTMAIPTAPAPCSQGFNDGEGGALYMRDGNLTVIDCTFSHNQAAQLGPDTGGGAIYITGSKHGAVIVGSVFSDNSASNAGAVGALFAELDVYNSLFENNSATGNGANSADSSKCSAMNNGQNEVGSGGNGGAIYQDGASGTNVILCGVAVTNNKAGANAFGGGVFMTSNDFSGSITIHDSTVTGNTGGSWTQVKSGVSNLGTAFGVNAKSADVQSSTLQMR